MTVKIKLYGDYLKYGPEETNVNLEEVSTVGDLLKRFSIFERKLYYCPCKS